MKRLLIIKTGQTYPDIHAEHGDFEDWFSRALQHPALSISVINPITGEHLPNDADGIVITGSPAMVSDREHWSEVTAAWLREAVGNDIPVLGICYGHQLLAHAMGGRVDYHPQGREIGTVPVQLTGEANDDPLFRDLPPVFDAHLTHRQSVLTLPEGARRLAHSGHEPNQAFRLGRHAWGVQFHPEFTSSIMAAYIGRLAPALRDEGVCDQHLLRGIGETPYARELLERFAQLVAAQ